MTEMWADVVGYEGVYEVSSLGRVKSLHNGQKIRSLCQIPNRYVLVNLSNQGVKNSCLVHRLVAGAFLGAPKDGEQVNHKNGNKHDNRLENLEYCTPSQNKKHSYDIGLCCMKGESHNRSKLTNEAVRQIREYLNDGRTHLSISLEVGIARSTISKINSGRAWAHLLKGAA